MSRGEIWVTVTPANGQERPTELQLTSVQSLLSGELDATVKFEGWESLYPKRTVRAVP